MSSLSIRVRYVEFRVSLLIFGDEMPPRVRIDKLDSGRTNPFAASHAGRGFYGIKV
jgi:hypothetical protein